MIKKVLSTIFKREQVTEIPGWPEVKEQIECAIDETPIDCADLQENYDEGESFKQDAINYYTGIPAPDYLQDDPWFSTPVLSEKQVTYKEAHEQAVAEQQILDESAEGESSDIHQKLYDLATANWNTVAEAQAQYQGGSENFHEGPGGWNSGNGFSRVSG